MSAALKKHGLKNREFARMLAADAGKADNDSIEKERRGVVRRRRGTYFQDPVAERYARVLGEPLDYFKVGKPPPARSEVAALKTEVEDVSRRVDELWNRLPEVGES